MLFQRTLGEQMILEISARPLAILADWGQLSTAMMNLLSNAREASASRGVVSIDIRAGDEMTAPTAIIEVRDQGRGMSEAEVARAIEPFYSTKEATIATGLGLSRVYGFVEQSGGTLKITSAPGDGTSVTLVFPVAADGEGSDALVHDFRLWSLRVLLVDDNRAVRGMVAKMLSSLGHVVSTAASGEEALRMLEEEPPELLITDVLMPGELGGNDLARAARERQPDLPVLMISGFAEAPELDYPLLSKPFRMTDLEKALRTLLANGDR